MPLSVALSAPTRHGTGSPASPASPGSPTIRSSRRNLMLSPARSAASALSPTVLQLKADYQRLYGKKPQGPQCNVAGWLGVLRDC